MNAENYVKAFQGVMGVYGLQFLLLPKKIVRNFFLIALVVFPLALKTSGVFFFSFLGTKLFHFVSGVTRV